MNVQPIAKTPAENVLRHLDEIDNQCKKVISDPAKNALPDGVACAKDVKFHWDTCMCVRPNPNLGSIHIFKIIQFFFQGT